MKELRFTGINYYCHREYSLPDDVIRRHIHTDLFLQELKDTADISLIKHMSGEGAVVKDEITYRFFTRKNSFWQIPFRAHGFAAAHKPGLVVVQGLIFPLQVIALRKKLGWSCKILLQHQGEVPFRKKRIFQKIADRYVDGYLFSAPGLAGQWQEAGIIKDISKCFELPPASFLFKQKDKQTCKTITGIDGQVNFLWAGRLNANKDPLTVLAGFEKYGAPNPGAKLYMIYQEENLLEDVKSMIRKSEILNQQVVLVGKVLHSSMELWYSAADYIISGSHHEGGSYALMEAMACGCVPVVTNIPASAHTISNGKLGYIFERGKSGSLSAVLFSLKKDELMEKSTACVRHYEKEMSPFAIAKKLLRIYEALRFK